MRVTLAAWLTIASIITPVLAENKVSKRPSLKSNQQVSLNKVATYITSESLTANHSKRTFSYQRNVVVKHGDITIKCNMLDGSYDENNQILKITALGKVIVTRGEDLRSTSNRADYDAKNETIVLTESPEITQNGSSITANKITIFTANNRSEAEGNVKVKVIEKKNTTEKLK